MTFTPIFDRFIDELLFWGGTGEFSYYLQLNDKHPQAHFPVILFHNEQESEHTQTFDFLRELKQKGAEKFI